MANEPQCGILRNFVSRCIFCTNLGFFREIEALKSYIVKIALQNSIFDIFGAKMRKSGLSMPKSRVFEDFKSVEEPGIHWTLTELCQCKVIHFQPPFTAY